MSHAVFGTVTKSLYLAGVHEAVDFPAVPGLGAAAAADAHHLAAVQDLVVFEPWFLAQGVVLAWPPGSAYGPLPVGAGGSGPWPWPSS